MNNYEQGSTIALTKTGPKRMTRGARHRFQTILKKLPANNRAAILVIVLFGSIGTYMFAQSHAATPTASVQAESGTLASAAGSVVSDSTASGSQAVKFTTAPTGGGSSGSYPARGAAGYQAANCPSGLKTVNSSATAPTGTSWSNSDGFLTVTGTSVQLNCVQVIGGLYSNDGGTLHITNSIIQGNGASYWMIIGINSGNLDIEHSTVRYGDGSGYNPTSNGTPCIAFLNGETDGVKIIGNDISGNGDGIGMNGNNWTITDNYIHLLSEANDNHNDGIQIYNGTGTIARNRIEPAARAQDPGPNSAIFTQGDSVGPISIDNNYFNGGVFSLYLEIGANLSITNNVFGPYFYYSPDSVAASVTTTAWTNNCLGDASGAVYTPCQAVARQQ